jgi:hypothetical protein
MSPSKSEDLTEFVLQEGDQFIALRSPDTAEHNPDYEELGRFPTQTEAEQFIAEFDPALSG